MAGAIFVLGRAGGRGAARHHLRPPGATRERPSSSTWARCVDCKPIHLVQFALMGEVYARRVMGVARPRVAILANGEEESKGTELTRAPPAALRRSQHRLRRLLRGARPPHRRVRRHRHRRLHRQRGAQDHGGHGAGWWPIILQGRLAELAPGRGGRAPRPAGARRPSEAPDRLAGGGRRAAGGRVRAWASSATAAPTRWPSRTPSGAARRRRRHPLHGRDRRRGRAGGRRCWPRPREPRPAVDPPGARAARADA